MFAGPEIQWFVHSYYQKLAKFVVKLLCSYSVYLSEGKKLDPKFQVVQLLEMAPVQCISILELYENESLIAYDAEMFKTNAENKYINKY